MASGKLTPRQKMINMMYLVLLALLALNVSKEILKAFHLMEVTFVQSNKNIDDKNKNIVEFQSVGTDITDIKRENEKLSDAIVENQERFRRLTIDSKEVYVIVDPDSKVKYISPSIESLVGKTPADSVGKSCSSFIKSIKSHKTVSCF